jgi:Ca-activated chloride channel family protein
VNDIVLLHPERLWWAALLIPLLVLGALRLSSLGPWRRRLAFGLEVLSVLLLLGALAQPARIKPDTRLNLVLVLDTSDSLSATARQTALTFIQSTLTGAGPADRVRVVAAAGQAVLLTPQEAAGDLWPAATAAIAGAGGNTRASDLAAGLRLAGSLLSDSGRRRVVLLSDGWATAGQVADEATQLRARGIDLQVVPLVALGTPEVILEGVSTPPYARQGDTLSSQVRIFSTAAATATLQVRLDGAPLTTRPITLQPGENQVALEQTATALGYHHLDVTVAAAADSSATNNAASATVVVKPQPRILVLEDRPGEAASLVRALSTQQMTVDVQPSGSVPSRVQDLDGYDSIILNNVAATSLTLDQQRTLQEYVRREGRGLVVVGGQTSYARGGYADSTLEEMLPVSSQPPPRPQKGATALVLVLDRSGSMYISDGPDQPNKLALAKEAARLAVDALRPGDTIGVVVFDDQPEWTVPIQQIAGDADKEAIKAAIAGIDVGAGTSIYPAVVVAEGAIRQVTAPTKHLVLLTDGQEFGHPDYGAVLDDMRANGITLSSIGIGADADKDLLTYLARLGNGRYYFTERLQNIPQIVFKEVDVALQQSVKEGLLQPHFQVPSPVLHGFAPQDLPQLGGYDITTAKPEAVVGLVSDEADPLLAHWNYGLGRVLAFTSAVDTHWGGGWLTWDEFARFWNGAVRWTMANPVERQLQPTITVRPPAGAGADAGIAHLTVESIHADNSFADLATLTAALRSPTGVVTTTLLAQTAPGRYEADVPVGEAGAYEVRVARQEGDTTVQETAGFSIPPNPELLHAGTNTRLLQQLVNGQTFLNSPAGALDPTGLQGAAPDKEPLWPYLLLPGLLLLLAGVAVRRVAFTRRRVSAPAGP